MDRRADPVQRSDSLARMLDQIDRISQKAGLADRLDSARGKVLEEHADRLVLLGILNRALAGLAHETGQLLE